MAGTYYQISEQEMREFLQQQGFKQIDTKDNTREIVYGKRVDQDNCQLTLRIYTSIVPGEDARQLGKDAIRCNLFWRSTDGQKILKIGGGKRVYRVENWKVNLLKRIQSWTEHLPEHNCERCGAPMTIRENKASKEKFLACVGYPECKNTRSVKS